MGKTLIYIIGAGRSGTTLLDIVLGNNSDSISLGEINRFFKRSGNPPKRDSNSQVYKFWEEVKYKIENQLDNLDYNSLDEIFDRNEYHSKLFKSIFRKNDPEYLNALMAQYKALVSCVDQSYLIESSKYPVRALNLSSYIKDDFSEIKFIYLRKDPVLVVESFQKKNLEQPSKSFLEANLYYVLVNILCSLTCLILRMRGHKVYNMKYKDFISHTDEILEDLSDSINIDCNDLKKQIEEKKPLKSGFLFDGNRIRLKETLTLKILKNTSRNNFKYYFTRIFNYLIYR